MNACWTTNNILMLYNYRPQNTVSLVSINLHRNHRYCWEDNYVKNCHTSFVSTAV